MCGRAPTGSDSVLMTGEEMSWSFSKPTDFDVAEAADLLEQVRSQHQNLCICSEALNRGKVAHSFLRVFLRRHDLENIEGCP